MANETVYINEITAIKEGQYGINVYIKDVSKLAEFLNKNANKDGSIRIKMSKRKTADKYNNTHFAALDTWQPDGNKRQGETTTAKSYTTTTGKPQQQDDDLPF